MQNHMCPFLVVQPQGQSSTPLISEFQIRPLKRVRTLPVFKDAEFNNCDLAKSSKIFITRCLTCSGTTKQKKEET
jgi:hypothetical protein